MQAVRCVDGGTEGENGGRGQRTREWVGRDPSFPTTSLFLCPFSRQREGRKLGKRKGGEEEGEEREGDDK